MVQAATNPLARYFDADAVPAQGDGTLSSIDRVLDAVREHLGMEIAFASHIHDGLREFTHIRADCPVPVAPGVAEPLDQTLCGLVLEGTLPQLMINAQQYPAALPLPITTVLPVGSHLNVPLRLADGSLYGTFCCVSRVPDLSLTERDMGTLRAFADLAAHLIERELIVDRRQAAASSKVNAMLASESITIVHQPIHDLQSAVPVGVECLARFPDAAERGPDCWFADASSVGLGTELELMAVRNALRTLQHVPPHCYLAVNVSPATVISGALAGLFGQIPPGRLVVEVTEHDQVEDYRALRAAIDPLRGNARIAIDDVGAGYAGLRHLVDLKPDILKLDMSLTRDISADPARKALTHALVHFAAEVGAKIIAEGVETEAERQVLAQLGVPLAQGYLFSRPMPVVAAQQLLLGQREGDPPPPALRIARRA